MSSVTETFIPPPNAVSRIQEKHELQEINDRFSQYIQGMRDVREAANEQNLQAFVESISVLENGLQNLKNLYEKELDHVRRDANDLNRTKNEYLLEIEKCRHLNAELENKLAQTSDKHRRTTDEVNQLHRSLVLKEQEVRDQQVAMKRPVEELDQLHKDYEDLLRENQDLRRKYEAEQFTRRETDDQLVQLRQKHDFHQQVTTQEKNDLSDRLHRASNTIVNLETKIRELNEALDSARGEMLTRVHEAAESELRRYQAESEQMFNRSITALKIQMDEDRRKLEDLTTKNIGLTSDIGELLQTIRSLESDVAGLEHQKQALENIMTNERQHSREHVQFLEKKLRDVQDVLVEKMRELNTSRDAQIPMKAEIEALKSMLEQEEKRIYQPLDNEAVSARPLYGLRPGESKNTGRLPPASRTTTQLTAQPVGPVSRAKSAPVFSHRSRLIPAQLGQGKDYFDAMFYDLRNETQRILSRTPTPPKVPTPDRPSTSPVAPVACSPSPVPERPSSSMSHEYTAATSSATGDVKILEVHPEGKYVRIINTNPTNEEEIGGYSIQQNVEGHPVAAFVFPDKLTLAPNKFVTVWSGSSDAVLHNPPYDFIFTEHNRWGTGPDCTTILCKPTGQAVAWGTSARIFNKDAFDSSSQGRSALQTPGPTTPLDQQNIQNVLPVHPDSPTESSKQSESSRDEMKEAELTQVTIQPNGSKLDPVYIRRVKEEAPGLVAQKHPHGNPPSDLAHPATGAPRPKTYGNDNSSVNRQSRTQSTRPDPIPGAPYAGASAQRMGSSMLRRYTPPQIRGGSGAVANKAIIRLQYGPPTPFLSQHQQQFALAHDMKKTSVQIIPS